jgi:hypothetical protein
MSISIEKLQYKVRWGAGHPELLAFKFVMLASFHPREYIAAIQAAARGPFDVLIIDSFSHA